MTQDTFAIIIDACPFSHLSRPVQFSIVAAIETKIVFDRFIRKICYRFVENINRSSTIHTGYNDITTRFRITVLTRRRWPPFPTFSTRMIYDQREEYRIARLLQLPVYFTIIPPLPRSAGYIRPSHEYALLLFRDFPSRPSSTCLLSTMREPHINPLATIYRVRFRNFARSKYWEFLFLQFSFVTLMDKSPNYFN